MKAFGTTTRQMVKADSYTVTEMCMRVNGSMTKQRDRVSTHTWMEHVILVTGKKTNSMDKGKRLGLMGLCMKDSTTLARNKEWATFSGQMGLSIRGSS